MLALLLVTLPDPPGATVPLETQFQGLLTDPNGQPRSGPVDLAFALFELTEGGVPVWNESHPGVILINGVYSVTLGVAVPLSPQLLSRPLLFLEVRVNGETLRPRHLLRSVPLAVRARLAEEVPDGSISAGKIGEPCASGQILVHTGLGWSCGDAPAGAAGVACWDLDGNGACDLPGEDRSGDGLCSAADCQGSAGAAGVAGTDGADGTAGVACWDLNGNAVCDVGEDSDGNLVCNVFDCRGPQGLPGDTGAEGAAGPSGADGALAGLICAHGEVAIWDGTGFACAGDAAAVSEGFVPTFPGGAFESSAQTSLDGVVDSVIWRSVQGGTLLTGAEIRSEPNSPTGIAVTSISVGELHLSGGIGSLVGNFRFQGVGSPFDTSVFRIDPDALELPLRGTVGLDRYVTYRAETVRRLGLSLSSKPPMGTAAATSPALEWWSEFSTRGAPIRDLRIDLFDRSLTVVLGSYSFTDCVPLRWSAAIGFGGELFEKLHVECRLSSISGSEHPTWAVWLNEALAGRTDPRTLSITPFLLDANAPPVDRFDYGTARITRYLLPSLDVASRDPARETFIIRAERLVVQPPAP